MNGQAHTDLLLTKNTFVALTDEMLVFLELHNDNYSCLERRHTKFLTRLLGLPTEDDDEPEGVTEDRDHENTKVVEDLMERGLVTGDAKVGKRAEFVTQHSEITEMLGYMPGDGPQVRFSDIIRFFRALIVTKSLIKFASMERIVMRVKQRKDRYYAKGEFVLDDERLSALVETYKILRPLFVTVKDNCLFNSLFLIEFLACYRVFPKWYFGVRLNEFYAHCWVQDRNVIYDDFIQNTCQNQPIMTV